MEKELFEKHVIVGNFTANRYQNGNEMEWGNNGSEYPSRKEFDKTLFVVYKGVLRQFRIKEVIVFPFNWGIKMKNSFGIYNNVTIIEMAGIGILNVGLFMWGGRFDFPVYESVEDYKNGKEYKMSYTRVSKDGCEKRFGVEFVKDYVSNGHLYRWVWNGTSAVRMTFGDSMPICYIVTKEGIELPDGWSPKELSGYATKEECDADNSINVCCFDNEEVKKVEEKKVIRLSIEIEEDDLEKIKSIAKVITNN